MIKLIGRKVVLYKADEEGKATKEVVLAGTYQGLARDSLATGTGMASKDVALVLSNGIIHKVLIEQLNFK